MNQTDEHSVSCHTQRERELEVENTELRIRLAAAEEALRAWRGGDGDDVLVSSGAGSQVDRGLIQQLKEQREALRKNEAILRSILDAAQESIWLFSPDGLVLLANEIALLRLRKSAEEVIGRPFSQFIPENLAQARQACLDQVVETGHPVERVDERSGISFHHNFYPVRDAAGRVIQIVAFSRDVTRQQQVEQALRQSEERFRVALQNAPITVATLDRDLRYTWVYNTRHGFRPERVLGKRPDELIAPEEAAELMALLRQALETGLTVHGEASGRTRGERWVYDVTAAPLREADGQVNGLTIANIDITERKHLEETLRRQSEELKAAWVQAENDKRRLEAVMEALPIGVAITDVNGGSLQVNHEYDRVWSGPRPAPQSINDYAAYQAWWADSGRVVMPEEWASAQAVLKGENVVGQLLEIQRFDGSRAFVINSASPVRDASGQIVGSAVAIQDITELHRIQVALRESEARFSKFFHLSPMAINVFRLSDGRSIDVNDAFVALTGYARDEIVGHTASDLNLLVAPEQRAAWLTALREHGSFRDLDAEIRQKSGAIINVLISMELLEVNGEAMGIILAVDITARKWAEAALRQSEERYRTLFDTLIEAFCIIEMVFDAENRPIDYRLLEVNPAFEQQTGLHQAQGKLMRELVPEHEAHWFEIYGEVALTGKPVRFANEAKGLHRWYDVHAYRVGAPENRRVAILFTDITGRKKKEEELQRLNRILRAHSHSDQAQLRATTEADYLTEVCRIVTEDCGHALVWIGYAEETEDRPVRPVAYAGFEEGYLETLKISWADTERGRGPTGAAIRTGKPTACRDMRTDPRFAPWRAEAVRRGYASSVSVPLLAYGRAFGAMTIYSREPDSFSNEEVELLSSLASDLAYGITAIRTRTAHAQAEAALRRAHVELELRIAERTKELAQANAELRLQMAAVRAAGNGIVITDGEGNIRWCNPAFTQMTGYTAEEILNQNIRLLKSGEQPAEFYRSLWDTIQAGQVWQGELVNQRKDGSRYVEEQTIAPVLSDEGQIANFVAVKQDVTDRKRAEDRLKQNNLELLALSKAEHHLRLLAETLTAANAALTQSLNLETVLETLLDCVERLIPYDSANVMLLESESRLAVQVSRGYERWGKPENARTIAFDVQTNRVLKALLTSRQSRLVSDTALEPGWEMRPGAEHVRSWLGVPLVAGGNVIGLYSLDKAEPGFFTPEHVRLAEMLVGQAAVAIQNAWLYEQVRAGRERLQSLSRRLVEVQEAERQYVARELHDEAGQALTSLLFGLNQIEQQAENPKQATQVIELKELTNNVIDSLHRLAMDLRPASLDYLGLIPALLQQVKTIGNRYGLIAQFKAIGLENERLPSDMEIALYRIVQEALTNIIRHAQATRVDVLLERRGDRIVVVVEDDGRGFDAETARFTQEGHLGLAGIQERAEMLGGSLVIESTAGIGTTIVVEVPDGNSNSGRG